MPTTKTKTKQKRVENELKKTINELQKGTVKNPEKKMQKISLLLKKMKKTRKRKETLNWIKLVWRHLKWWSLSYNLHQNSLHSLGKEIRKIFHELTHGSPYKEKPLKGKKQLIQRKFK